MEKTKDKKYNDLLKESERQRFELLKQNNELREQIDLLNSKMDVLKGIYNLVKIKAKLEGDPISSEWDEIIQAFFTLTTNTDVLWVGKAEEKEV
jgi:hypothetical protein